MNQDSHSNFLSTILRNSSDEKEFMENLERAGESHGFNGEQYLAAVIKDNPKYAQPGEFSSNFLPYPYLSDLNFTHGLRQLFDQLSFSNMTFDSLRQIVQKMTSFYFRNQLNQKPPIHPLSTLKHPQPCPFASRIILGNTSIIEPFYWRFSDNDSKLFFDIFTADSPTLLDDQVISQSFCRIILLRPAPINIDFYKLPLSNTTFIMDGDVGCFPFPPIRTKFSNNDIAVFCTEYFKIKASSVEVAELLRLQGYLDLTPADLVFLNLIGGTIPRSKLTELRTVLPYLCTGLGVKKAFDNIKTLLKNECIYPGPDKVRLLIEESQSHSDMNEQEFLRHIQHKYPDFLCNQ